MTRVEGQFSASQALRLRIAIHGAVQGVGFRPFVYRLATTLNLAGWVSNTSQGLFIEVEGAKEVLEKFLVRLEAEKPGLASIQSLEFSFLDVAGFRSFEIRKSEEGGVKSAFVLPDIASCPDCLAEIFDPTNRRYLYPFTNCTNCGPRFSIIESLPYDRPNTSMKRFRLCPACQKEYDDPNDRRFHAQPTACPNCGPRLEFLGETGLILERNERALQAAAQAVREEKVLAVKGLGGFHLVVDARSDDAVRRLRERKRREEKPLALMFPSIDMVMQECVVSEMEERILRSPESPIVLLDRIDNRELYGKHVSSLGLAPSIAPGSPALGIMLPYTPLHHLLLKDLGHPVVATSGNLSDEPICIDEQEAVRRLKGIADCFLVHDRPIVRHVDDSVVRMVSDRQMILRRARGFAPLPIQVPIATDEVVLALGAHLKNTVALALGSNVFLSQHIGDLETRQSLEAFKKVGTDLQELYEGHPSVAACDLHPDYVSSREARSLGLQVIEIQHHYAHVLACMAENDLDGDVLGVSWDGTGYGPDGSVWGGEFLLSRGKEFERIASLKPFCLPGGEKAIQEPRRSAVGVVYELLGDEAFLERDRSPINEFTVAELSVLRQMLHRGVNSPRTSSIGRLFDAVASLTGIRQYNTFEGQAAMQLEDALAGVTSEQFYRCHVVVQDLRENAHQPGSQYQPRWVLDWSTMIQEIMADVRRCVPVSLISKKFHNGLVEAIADVATHAGTERVVLTGGCFQNKYLTERAIRKLRSLGLRPYWHQRVPPNDGGISLGQAVGALLQKVRGTGGGQGNAHQGDHSVIS